MNIKNPRSFSVIIFLLIIISIFSYKSAKEEKDTKILKLLSRSEKVMLDACDGKETIANSKEVFPLGIDSEFTNWGIKKPGIATKEIEVHVHEMEQNATFVQMFGFIRADLDKLCLTQSQIKNFCKKHFNWLRKEGYATFFLFKVEDQFFVADVRVPSDVLSDGLSVHVFRFGHDHLWHAERKHRVVVSKIDN